MIVVCFFRDHLIKELIEKLATLGFGPGDQLVVLFACGSAVLGAVLGLMLHPPKPMPPLTPRGPAASGRPKLKRAA